MVLGICVFAGEQAGIFLPTPPPPPAAATAAAVAAPPGSSNGSISSTSGSNMMWFGILLLTGAVTADGFLSNISAQTLRRYTQTL